MGTKISQFPLLEQANGEQLLVTSYGGITYSFKLSSIKSFITKQDVGLGNVDNTSDADKPISNLQAQALNQKANSQHNHQIADVTGLQNALDGKASSVHNHQISDVNGLQLALDGKTDVGHGHSIGDIVGLTDALLGKANSIHRHSKSDIDGLNDDLISIYESLNNKSNIGHGHNTSEINGLDDFVTTRVDVKVGTLEW